MNRRRTVLLAGLLVLAAFYGEIGRDTLNSSH